MKNIDTYTHLRGESIYVDDIPVREGTLHGAVLASPIAHGLIQVLDFREALELDGVVAVLTARDIPGENQIGGIIMDEPLFAEGEVHFAGQPIAVVFAENEAIAREAVHRIRLECEEKPALLDPREAAARGELHVKPRTFQIGDPDSAWAQCAHVIRGRADSGGQEHLYIEAQGAYAYPLEHGGIHIFSSTQGPTAVQRTCARVLGEPMHRIEVEVARLGGGFGGKEDQATPWAIMVALGAFRLRRPCKLILHRLDDMRMTGKRHPYSSDFKIGLDAELKILAYEVRFYQDAGAAADLSPAVLERTLFHHGNAYYLPNSRATAYSCRTNVVPHTAFRGFGGPQGMFVIEAAIAAAAERLGVGAHEIQRRNLIQNGDRFPYGQFAEAAHAHESWEEAERRFELDAVRAEIAAFNSAHRLRKRGLAMMPICFGISFTKTHMNQAGALVHVYQDGSVGVATAAVEMGQGVNTKMVQVAGRILGIPVGRIKIETTSTSRVANSSPTAASASADLNGKAVELACSRIHDRLLAFAADKLGLPQGELDLHDDAVYHKEQATQLTWPKLVQEAYFGRIALSEHAHYATPEIHFDPKQEKGHPFAYHVYGTAAIQAEIDVLRGTYEIQSVQAVHDFGTSFSPVIDRGQVEGGIVQGIGWMTMEELVFDDQGRLRSNSLSTYKVPDIYAAPERIEVHFLQTEGHPLAIFGSKAVGEPPLMYGIGAYFALRQAIRAYRKEGAIRFQSPMTPERVLMALHTVDLEAEAQES